MSFRALKRLSQRVQGRLNDSHGVMIYNKNKKKARKKERKKGRKKESELPVQLPCEHKHLQNMRRAVEINIRREHGNG